MGQNNFEEQSEFNYRWVWTNTLTYNKTFNDIHKLTVLLGTEAIRDGLGRKLTGRRYNYLFEDNTNSWVLNMGENNNQRLANSEYKGEFALFGLFGRVDYSFNDKYCFFCFAYREHRDCLLYLFFIFIFLFLPLDIKQNELMKSESFHCYYDKLHRYKGRAALYCFLPRWLSVNGYSTSVSPAPTRPRYRCCLSDAGIKHISQ